MVQGHKFSVFILIFFLQVVEGDIFLESSLQPFFEGKDAVVSCLGIHTGWLQPITFYSQSIKPIIAAMKGAKVNRFITMTTWCTKGKVEFFIQNQEIFQLSWSVIFPVCFWLLVKRGLNKPRPLPNCTRLNKTLMQIKPGSGHTRPWFQSHHDTIQM